MKMNIMLQFNNTSCFQTINIKMYNFNVFLNAFVPQSAKNSMKKFLLYIKIRNELYRN